MSAELVVGLLDSGVEAALCAHLRASRAFVDETRPGSFGHGTAIARIILRHAPGAAIVHAQVFGERQRTTPELVAAGLDWLRDEGARIVNMSFGLRHDRAVLRHAIVTAQSAGMTLVASGPARGAMVYPGGYAGVIRVSGDARCAPGEISALGGDPADYGACPHDAAGRLGGASFAAAHVTGLLARRLRESDCEPRALLDRLARFHGRERRLA
jgi:subtilisin family serine protease